MSKSNLEEKRIIHDRLLWAIIDASAPEPGPITRLSILATMEPLIDEIAELKIAVKRLEAKTRRRRTSNDIEVEIVR